MIVIDDAWTFDVVTACWEGVKRHTCLPRMWHTAVTMSDYAVLIYGGCMVSILLETLDNHVSVDELLLLSLSSSLLLLLLSLVIVIIFYD